MADGYFERGEVYWIGKLGSATLGVVVSSNQDNNTSDFVTVASVCGEMGHRAVKIEATGRTSYVNCANIRTVPKWQIQKLAGKLSQSEIRELDNHLEEFFDLGYEDVTKDREIEKLRGEVARLKREVEYGKEGILSRAAEVEKYKKLYEKAVDQIADMTLAADVAKRIAEKKVEVSEEPEPAEEPELEVVAVVEETAPVEEEIFEEPVVEEPPVEVKKPNPEPVVVEFTPEIVNVNTATAQEIADKTGLSLKDAYAITGYRKKNGLFVELEELLEVSRISKPKFEKYKEWFTLGESSEGDEAEESEEPDVCEEFEDEVVTEKVNVNEANVYELMRVGFGKSEAARIQRWVKKYGPFTSLDDLVKVDGVTGKLLRKIRDGLEV